MNRSPASDAGGNGIPGDLTAQAVLDLGPGEWLVWDGDPLRMRAPVKMHVAGDMPADVTGPDADRRRLLRE